VRPRGEGEAPACQGCRGPGILARVTRLTLDELRLLARLADLGVHDEELEALRPAIERALASLAELERLPLGDVEPTTQYRVT